MARQQPTRSSNVAIEDVISTAVEVAGYAIRSSDVQLSISLQPGLPPIWADPDQLSQVLINLLVNAEQALHGWDGPRRIALSARRDTRTGKVVVRVGDTGPGIPKDILPRIFEPFFTTKEVGSGTGIGLSFCHRIVQSHGGTIKVETGDGRGSTFVVSLPISATADTTSTRPSITTRRRRRACPAWWWTTRRRSATWSPRCSPHDGFEVTVARSGEEALKELKERSFGLILRTSRCPTWTAAGCSTTSPTTTRPTWQRLAFLTGDTISPDAQVFLRPPAGPIWRNRSSRTSSAPSSTNGSRRARSGVILVDSRPLSRVSLSRVDPCRTCH